MLHSKLYVGQVKHRRFAPVNHQFDYRMFMLYLDLDELPMLFDRFLLWSARGFNLAWFNRKKHLGEPDQDLKQSVINLVKQRSGITLEGPVRLLTHLSYFGYGFNPVSFYYCFDKSGDRLQVIVAEVNNTPGMSNTAMYWMQRHLHHNHHKVTDCLSMNWKKLSRLAVSTNALSLSMVFQHAAGKTQRTYGKLRRRNQNF